MIKVVTPISHLFENKEYKKIILENSDLLECRDRSIDYNEYNTKQELYHCDLQPIHEWKNAEWKLLEKVKLTKPNLKLITFHLASCCDNPSILKGKFEVGGKVYTSAEMKSFAKKNFYQIKKLFGSKIDIGVENNNFYDTDAYRDITNPDFISQIVNDNNIKFLFDIAHAKVTCFNKNINYFDYKKNLPLDKIIQIHLSGYDINKDIQEAFDAHNLPNNEDFLETQKIISEFNTLKYLTVEFYRDIEDLKLALKTVKKIL